MTTSPRNFIPIDFDRVKVGRPVTSPRAYSLIDGIHHVAQHRRIMGHAVAYSPGSTEISTPSRVGSATVPSHTFRHFTGPNTVAIHVHVWTHGAAGSGTNDPFLTATTTTDAAGVDLGHVVRATTPATAYEQQITALSSGTAL